MALTGPTTRVLHQDLPGRGWAVGALLTLAAEPFFAGAPGEPRGASLDIAAQIPAVSEDAVLANAMVGLVGGTPELARVGMWSWSWRQWRPSSATRTRPTWPMTFNGFLASRPATTGNRWLAGALCDGA